MNSPVARQQAAALAQRLTADCGTTIAFAVERAWLLAFSRAPKPNEMRYATEFLDKRNRELGSIETALSDLCLALFNASEFIYLD